MYKNILVPLDGSEVAECVLPHVEELAKNINNAIITFLFCVKPLDNTSVKYELKTRIENDEQESAVIYLKSLVKRLKYKDSVNIQIVKGKEDDCILNYAEHNNIDLIIISSHGQSGIRKTVRGNIADKVLNNSRIPVLRIRASAPRVPFHLNHEKLKLLVPLDGSTNAESAVQYATNLAILFTASQPEIVLLRVCEVLPHYQANSRTAQSGNYDKHMLYEIKQRKKLCSDYLAGVKKRFSGNNIQIRSVVETGLPSNIIRDYAEINKINVIVLSTHSHNHRNSAAFNNIADAVIRGTSIPTLILKPDL